VLLQVTKQQLPSAGVLSLTFVAKHRAPCEVAPLTDAEFETMWLDMVDPRRLAKAAAAVEHQLNLNSHGPCGPLDGPVMAPSQGLTAAGAIKSTSRRTLADRQGCRSAKNAAVLAALGVGSWYGASQVGAWGSTATGQQASHTKYQGTGNGALDPGGAGSCHLHGITDGWKLQLLQVCFAP
jgi:hypothetical protein